jgi:alkanesulfonate monooxygenase SsuD/methylene tetrahydromethanopterin reductase-like flavin-dependent oxidoreductase (luciferase family)
MERLRDALQADARERRSDEGHLDEIKAGVSRRVCQLRANPVQKPHPPILVGGVFPHAARRAIRYGDGWIPTARRDLSVEPPRFRQIA